MAHAFDAPESKMRAAGLSPLAIRSFRRSFDSLLTGDTGRIPEGAIASVDSLPHLEELQHHSDAGLRALPRTVVLKLNGGLGTSMGTTRAKSLLPAKADLSFLEIIAQQTLSLRQRFDVQLPLVLMNSFRTRDDSLAVLARHPSIDTGVPTDFLQSKVPKILTSDLSPLKWASDPSLEWCPPGHGDIYTSLTTSGMLGFLLDAGYEYAFISNADNLGATLDIDILGWMASEQIPFVMEVADRTRADRKGGHLARSTSDGRLMLRETAQCGPDDEATFQDIERHRFFNTNNLWIDLPALRARLEETDGLLGLPMIRNEKHADPRDPRSPRVYQLETAMGAAISCFDSSRALCVPRERFSPVKTTADLLALWSDAYVLSPDYRVYRDPAARPELMIDLDSQHYQRIDDFMKRFPEGAPSLLECSGLRISGDIRFRKDVVLRGSIELTNREFDALWIGEGTALGF